MNQLYHYGAQFTQFFNFKNKNNDNYHDILGSSVGNQADNNRNEKSKAMNNEVYNDLELIGKAVSFKHPLSGNVHTGLVCRSNKGDVDVRVETGTSHQIFQQVDVRTVTFHGFTPETLDFSTKKVVEETTASSLNLDDYAELAPKRRGRKSLVLEGLALLPAGRKEFDPKEFTSGMFYILNVDNSKTGGPAFVAVKTSEAMEGWDVGSYVKICHSRGHKNLPPSVVIAAFAPGDEIDEKYTKKMAHWPAV